MTKPVLSPDLANIVSPATILVRGGATRSPYDETCEALFLTSGFVYDDAAAAEAAFAQEGSRYVYSRYRNPTVAMFEERLRLLEGAEACRATASGMAAVFAALLCRLRAGQKVVSSRALFGSCHYIVADLLPRWGIETVLIDRPEAEESLALLAVVRESGVQAPVLLLAGSGPEWAALDPTSPDGSHSARLLPLPSGGPALVAAVEEVLALPLAVGPAEGAPVPSPVAAELPPVVPDEADDPDAVIDLRVDDDAAEPEDALITRPKFDVVVRRLPPGGAEFLTALLGGRPFGAAAESALNAAPSFDIAASIAGMIEAGAFVSARIGGPP